MSNIISYEFIEQYITKLINITKNETHEDERTVLYRTKPLDGTKPRTNPKTNPNPKLTLILTLFSCFMLFSSTVL